jgi:ParB-like chromosome segregation protein Spo0J
MKRKVVIKKIKDLKYQGVGMGVEEYNKLKESLLKDGFLKPIVVDKSNRVWDGLHRLLVCEKEGVDQVPVITIVPSYYTRERLDSLIERVSI